MGDDEFRKHCEEDDWFRRKHEEECKKVRWGLQAARQARTGCTCALHARSGCCAMCGTSACRSHCASACEMPAPTKVCTKGCMRHLARHPVRMRCLAHHAFRVHHPCLQIIIIKVVKVRLLLVMCAAAYACKPIARGACACHVAVPARLLHWQGAHSTTATVALLQCSTRCPSRRWHLPAMRLLPCTPGPLQHRQLWMWSALRHSLVNLVSGNPAVLHVNTADTNPGRCCSAGEAREGALRGEFHRCQRGQRPTALSACACEHSSTFNTGVPLLLPPA